MIFYTKLAGVTFSNENGNTENRQSIIRQLYHQGLLDDGTELYLKPEPNNPYDDHAVAVFAKDGRQLGYLPQRISYQVFGDMAKGKKYRAFVSCVTGGEAGNAYGINVRIEYGV